MPWHVKRPHDASSVTWHFFFYPGVGAGLLASCGERHLHRPHDAPSVTWLFVYPGVGAGMFIAELNDRLLCEDLRLVRRRGMPRHLLPHVASYDQRKAEGSNKETFRRLEAFLAGLSNDGTAPYRAHLVKILALALPPPRESDRVYATFTELCSIAVAEPTLPGAVLQLRLEGDDEAFPALRPPRERVLSVRFFHRSSCHSRIKVGVGLSRSRGAWAYSFPLPTMLCLLCYRLTGQL